MRKIDTIFVHCSATQPTGWFAELSTPDQIAEIDRWHKERGFNGFGYHYYIARDGMRWNGRPLEQAGAGVAGMNSRSIHICLEGGFGSSSDDKAIEHFTGDQLDELRVLLAELQKRFRGVCIRGHNEVSAKACPGFNVKRWLRAKGHVPEAATASEKATEAAVKGGPIGALAGVSAGGVAQSFAGWDSNAQIILAVAVVVAAMFIAWRYVHD